MTLANDAVPSGGQQHRDKVRSVVQLTGQPEGAPSNKWDQQGQGSFNGRPGVTMMQPTQQQARQYSPPQQQPQSAAPFRSKIIENANKNLEQQQPVNVTPWRSNNSASSGRPSAEDSSPEAKPFDAPMSSRLVAAASAATQPAPVEVQLKKTPSPPRQNATPPRHNISPPRNNVVYNKIPSQTETSPVKLRPSPPIEQHERYQQQNNPVPEFVNMKLRPSPPRSNETFPPPPAAYASEPVAPLPPPPPAMVPPPRSGGPAPPPPPLRVLLSLLARHRPGKIAEHLPAKRLFHPTNRPA